MVALTAIGINAPLLAAIPSRGFIQWKTANC